jgi:hypothetical protein
MSPSSFREPLKLSMTVSHAWRTVHTDYPKSITVLRLKRTFKL